MKRTHAFPLQFCSGVNLQSKELKLNRWELQQEPHTQHEFVVWRISLKYE